MKTLHRIRMAVIMRRANRILSRSRRPHVPSAHLVSSYPVPVRPPERVFTPAMIAFLMIMVGVAVAVNLPSATASAGCPPAAVSK